MTRHNKKRNTGLLYEFLARTVSDAIIEGDDSRRKIALGIVRTHFAKNTELFREFRLFHSLVATTVGSESVADSILEAAKQAAKSSESTVLDRQKSLLIRDINHKINDNDFYNRKIPEYKIYATVQTLLNEWRSGELNNIVKVAQFEEQLKQWLLQNKEVTKLDEVAISSSDPLVEKLMLKKINERYNGTLTKEQADLIRAYIFSTNEVNKQDLSEKIEEIKESTLKKIDDYLIAESGKNKYLENKLGKAKEIILSEGTDNITDVTIEKFLDISKLNYEISNEE